MKSFRKISNRAVSTLEYIFFITLLLFAILGFQKYFANGINGMWKRTGDSFAFGRQYDPNNTIECAYEPLINKWYDVFCLESFRCPAGDLSCKIGVLNRQCSARECEQ